MSKVVTCDKIPEAVGPYSVAKWAGDLLFISGQIGMTRGSKGLVDGGTVAQAEQTLRNLEEILSEVNLKWDDVVKVNIYLSDISDYTEVNNIYSRFLNNCEAMPARVCYEVAKLPLGAKVEIEAIAQR
ncbi:Rid family detoxifying hydrolase [Wukongibacter baidiensis]|uniref:Rid family detoxifying hydrolase n=1 Tax=Wukongibacter baidiensis TaxID=1723361 RepID=UPI003D7F4FD3